VTRLHPWTFDFVRLSGGAMVEHTFYAPDVKVAKSYAVAYAQEHGLEVLP
jgi:hypothetical protein